MGRWSAVGFAGFAGIGAALALLVATDALARSTISVGSYALSGNNAFVVLALGVPLALFGGWTTIEQLRGRDAAMLGAFALGLAAPLGTGATFFLLLPTALVAALVWSGFKSGRLPSSLFALGAFVLLGIIGPYLWPGVGGLVAGGLLVAPALVAANSRPGAGWRAAVGAALVGSMLVSAFVVPLALQAARPS